MGGKGEHALFSGKPFSSYKQQGAFPCVDIVLAYLGASWSRAIRAQADTAVPCGGKAPLPGRIHNTESRCRGAPLLPQPAVGCKTAAGKQFGSSSAVGSSQCTALATGHHEQGTTADSGLWIHHAGNAQGLFLP